MSPADVAEVCDKCDARAVVEDHWLGSAVCQSCGHVADDGMLQAKLTWDDGQMQGTVVSDRDVQAGYFFRRTGEGDDAGGIPALHGTTGEFSLEAMGKNRTAARYQAIAMLRRLSARLRLHKELQTEAQCILEEAIDGRWGSGAWMEVVLPACVYLAVRRAHVPLSMIEVADAAGQPPGAVWVVYRRVLAVLNDKAVPQLEPEMFLLRAVRAVPALASWRGEEGQRKLRQEASAVLRLGERSGLNTGRHPLPLAAAALLVVARGNKIVVTEEAVCSSIHAVLLTTRQRFQELWASLLSFSQSLPWGTRVDGKSLSHHLPFVLKMLLKAEGDAPLVLKMLPSTAKDASFIPSTAKKRASPILGDVSVIRSTAKKGFLEMHSAAALYSQPRLADSTEDEGDKGGVESEESPFRERIAPAFKAAAEKVVSRKERIALAKERLKKSKARWGQEEEKIGGAKGGVGRCMESSIAAPECSLRTVNTLVIAGDRAARSDRREGSFSFWGKEHKGAVSVEKGHQTHEEYEGAAPVGQGHRIHKEHDASQRSLGGLPGPRTLEQNRARDSASEAADCRDMVVSGGTPCEGTTSQVLCQVPGVGSVGISETRSNGTAEGEGVYRNVYVEVVPSSCIQEGVYRSGAQVGALELASEGARPGLMHDESASPGNLENGVASRRGGDAQAVTSLDGVAVRRGGDAQAVASSVDRVALRRGGGAQAVTCALDEVISSLDDEDLQIEHLLLMKAPEQALESGWYSSAAGALATTDALLRKESKRRKKASCLHQMVCKDQ